jgi:predicted RNA-binding Zn-ribbon protein involved in translation (DUF1610 family)
LNLTPRGAGVVSDYRMNFFFYGMIFIGVGVWQMYRKVHERRAGHVHRCPKCGARWHHASGDQYPTARAGVDAHTCPKCGAEQFEIDSIGALPAHVVPPPAAPLVAGGGVSSGKVEKPAGAHNAPQVGATPAPATTEKKPA